MVIDQSKCIGCGYCTLACQAHNDINPEIQWNKVIEDGMVGDKQVYVPRPCMHCEKAPCVEVCPVKASYYRDDGIVMMDYDRCIGCRYCQVACPYEARSFNWDRIHRRKSCCAGMGNSGSGATSARRAGEMLLLLPDALTAASALGLKPGVDPDATPACVVVCPTGARMFGDLNDPESNVSKALHENPSYRLRENLGTGPRVYYLPAVAAKKEA